MANNHDKGRITTNKAEPRIVGASVVDNLPLFVFDRAFVAAAGCAFRRSKTAGRLAVLQPSSLGNAVVEHKAQTHFEGFLHASLFAINGNV